MKGLIIKEFYSFKKIRNTYLAIALVLFVYCLITNKGIFVPTIPILIFSTAITSMFTLDDKVKWEQLILIGPTSRKDIVISKYLFLTIIILVSAIIGLVFSIPNLLSGSIKISSFIELTLLSIDIAICAIGNVISWIYIFRSSVEKMELLTMFSYFGAGVILFVLYKIFSFANLYFGFSKMNLILILTVFVILMYLAIMLITVKIYEKRDVS